MRVRRGWSRGDENDGRPPSLLSDGAARRSDHPWQRRDFPSLVGERIFVNWRTPRDRDALLLSAGERVGK